MSAIQARDEAPAVHSPLHAVTTADGMAPDRDTTAAPIRSRVTTRRAATRPHPDEDPAHAACIPTPSLPHEHLSAGAPRRLSLSIAASLLNQEAALGAPGFTALLTAFLAAHPAISADALFSYLTQLRAAAPSRLCTAQIQLHSDQDPPLLLLTLYRYTMVESLAEPCPADLKPFFERLQDRPELRELSRHVCVLPCPHDFTPEP